MTRTVLAAAVAALLLAGRPAPGDAVVPPAGPRATAVGETAVVIWDDVAGVEHFTRSVAFAGPAAEFGFLVPTPARPTLADAPGPIAEQLDALTKSRTETRQRLGTLGCAPENKFPRGATAPPPTVPPAAVVAPRQRAGDLDATVLPAADAAGVRDWLGRNGYDARPAVRDWLAGYAADGWHLTAFRVSNDPAGRPVGGHLPAVRLSFPTRRPVVPYQEPADAANPAGPPRLLRLFVLAPHRVEAVAGPTGFTPAGWLWPQWAGPLDRAAFEATATACGLPPTEVAALAARDWTLTEFQDVTSPRGAGPDLSFPRSPDQSTLERPPIIVVEDVYWPYGAAAGGLLVAGPVVVWLGWKLIRRAIRRLPAAPLD